MLVALADFDLKKDINNNPNFLDHDSIECKYNDEQSMISNFSSSKNPIAISINIESLSSKFEKFSDMIANFELNNLFFDVIAIQETSQKTEVDDSTRWQLVVLNSTSKLHLNLTLTPLLNSSHQLGEIWVH